MTENKPEVPFDIIHMDADEKALAGMTNRADRMKYHRKRLPGIQHEYGSSGVSQYRARFPEANKVLLKPQWPVAFEPKPKGYDAFLCKMVDTWFISERYLHESNRDAVERLNIAMAPARFNPNNHFSKPLSDGRIKKLAEIFTKHGAHLDTSKPMSMSQVREAVKVAKAGQSAGTPFANVGHVIGSQLVVGIQRFTIIQHNGHACIRLMVNGARVRLRLDALADFIGVTGLGMLPQITSNVVMGELAPNAEIDVPDPLAGIAAEQSPGELAPNDGSPQKSPGELAPNPEPPHSPAAPDDPDEGPDPLARS